MSKVIDEAGRPFNCFNGFQGVDANRLDNSELRPPDPSPVRSRRGFALITICLLKVIIAQAAPPGVDSEPPDKSRYTLLNPTPPAFMRELAADRPDKTDCPFTVDAGHFQVEMDFVNMTYNRPNSTRGNVKFTGFEVAPMNLKAGLLSNLDFQLVFTPYHGERTEDRAAGTTERKSGFDGITPRLKVNLIGNDRGPFALALLPYVKVPLSQGGISNGAVEGGLGIPYAFDLPKWELGLQHTIRFNRDEIGNGRHLEIDNSVSVGHPLIGKLSGFAEFFSRVSTERGAGWVGTVDTWVTYQVSQSLRLDGGIYIGVTPAADDWHPFLGMTWRF